MQEEIYCLGSFSNLVATQLEAINSSVTRRRNATKKTCLILIDRTLDFGSVMSFSSDSLLDRIQTVLPRLPDHSSDICVNMSPLCAGTVGSIAPGCLAHKGPVLEWLVNLKQKDVLLNLCQEFQNLNDIQIKYPLRNIPQLLDRQILSTYSKETMKLMEHSGFIEQVLAVTETLNSAKNSTVELAMSIEKLLLQTIAADNGTSGAINQLCQLFRCRHERKLSVEVLLCILVNLYSMVGTQFVFQRHEEETLKKEIVDALYNDRHLLKESVFRVNHEITQEKANDLGHHIISKLQALLVARNNFSKYRNVLKYEGPHQPLVYNGLLDQLLTDLTDPHKPPIPELVHKSQGLFRSGFSKLLSSSHPSDNQTFFLFIIGGVSGQETRKIIEYFKKVKKEVIVGSTCLVSPSDVLSNYLNFEKFC
uniref:Sec1 family domain-containing protein 2 n=2 Tax=Clastoptera arizonana TaxID=38151 RepID=A0A1B6DDQ3_9HEMI